MGVRAENCRDDVDKDGTSEMELIESTVVELEVSVVVEAVGVSAVGLVRVVFDGSSVVPVLVPDVEETVVVLGDDVVEEVVCEVVVVVDEVWL